MNDFMELRQVVTMILRRWWLLVLLIAIGAMLGYAISRGQTPVYEATTTVLVGQSITSSRVDRVDIQISEALMLTYVEIARHEPVLQGVATTLNLNESWQDLRKGVTVNNIEGTQLIEITAEANSPDLARKIADEVVNQLILLSPARSESAENQLTNSFNREQIASLQERIINGQKRLADIDSAINNSVSEIELAALQQEKTTLEGLIIEWERNYTQLLTLSQPQRDPTQLTVVEPAHSNNKMVRPRIQLNTMLGGALGMIVALGLVFLLDFLDETYRSLKDFSQSEEVNILGSIRKMRGKKLSDKLIAHFQPHSPVTESYRIIRSRIRFKRVDHPATKSIMVTSSMPEEGKSLTAANLAVVFAQANIKTIIVDADLRRPVLHEIFEVTKGGGLGDVLTSPEVRVEDFIKNTVVDNLQILTSGMTLPDPSGQLGSKRMEGIIAELKEIADIVIFDSPPALVFADAITLSRRMDGIIMVIQAGKSKRSSVKQTLLDLQNAGAEVLGSMFNKSPKSDTSSVGRMYMQERPRFSYARSLVKKADHIRDLPDSASARDETIEMPSSGNGSHVAKTSLPHEIKKADHGTSHQDPAPVYDLDDFDTSRNEDSEISMPGREHEVVDDAEISDASDPDMTADENLIMSVSENEQSGSNGTQSPDLYDSATPRDEIPESSDEKDEKAVASGDANNHPRRKRKRKSRQNELENDEVPVGSREDSMEQTDQ